MGGTLASRFSGLAREVLMVALFPVRATDAFRIAWAVPNLFRELLAEGALTNAFVPIYQRLRGPDRRDFASAMAAVLALVNGVLLALALLVAPSVVDLLLASASNVDRELAITLLRFTFPVLGAISFSALAMGILQAEERFFAPAWAPVALNLAAILAMLVAPGEPQVLALGVVVGGVAQALVQWPAMVRSRLAPRMGRWWHPAMPAALSLMAPFAFTAGARQLLNVVAQRIVSNELLFPAGAVTAYALAAMLFSLVLGLFAISPATAFYARLGNLAASGSEAFTATLAAGARFILFLTVPVGTLTYLFADPAVRAIFELLRPAAGQTVAIELAAQATAPLGVALPAAGLVNYLLRPFYVRQRVWGPVALTVIFSVVTATLYLWLTPHFGIAGLSWAMAVSMSLQTLVLLYWLRRSEGLDLRGFAGQAVRVGFAALVAGMSARALVGLWLPMVSWPSWWLAVATLLFAGSVALVLYAAIAYALKVPEARGWRRR
jgi:putative peptidoglycan lipid II flippase